MCHFLSARQIVKHSKTANFKEKRRFFAKSNVPDSVLWIPKMLKAKRSVFTRTNKNAVYFSYMSQKIFQIINNNNPNCGTSKKTFLAICKRCCLPLAIFQTYSVSGFWATELKNMSMFIHRSFARNNDQHSTRKAVAQRPSKASNLTKVMIFN